MAMTASAAGAIRKSLITLRSFPTRRSEMSRRTRQGFELLIRRVTDQAGPVPDLRDDRVAGALGPPDHQVVAAEADHLEAGLVIQTKLAVAVLRDDEERNVVPVESILECRHLDLPEVRDPTS